MRSVLLVLLLLSAPALAKSNSTEEARRYFDAGKQLYESDQFGAAALAFDQAYKLEPRPAILFSLAQAHRKQYYLDRDPGRLRRAVDLYRQYVSENAGGTRMADALQILSALEPLLAKVQGQGPLAAPATPAATRILVSSRSPGATVSLDGGAPVKIPILLEAKAGQHKAVVTAPGFFPDTATVLAVEGDMVVHAAALKEKPARLAIAGSDGASVSLDGRLVGTTPFPRPLELSAGRRFLTITERGHVPLSREIVLRRGEETRVDADLPATGQRLIAWGVLAGAGALAVGGGVTTALAFKAQSDTDGFTETSNTEAELDDFQANRERRDRYLTTSAVLFGGAAALGATALLLFLTDNPAVEAPPQGPSITPTATPEGDVGVSLTTPF